MKPDTRNAYARRVDAVLARLQQAIAAGDDLPGLDALAAVATSRRSISTASGVP